MFACSSLPQSAFWIYSPVTKNSQDHSVRERTAESRTRSPRPSLQACAVHKETRFAVAAFFFKTAMLSVPSPAAFFMDVVSRMGVKACKVLLAQVRLVHFQCRACQARLVFNWLPASWILSIVYTSQFTCVCNKKLNTWLQMGLVKD